MWKEYKETNEFIHWKILKKTGKTGKNLIYKVI